MYHFIFYCAVYKLSTNTIVFKNFSLKFKTRYVQHYTIGDHFAATDQNLKFIGLQRSTNPIYSYYTVDQVQYSTVEEEMIVSTKFVFSF